MPPTLSRESSLDAISGAWGALHANDAEAYGDASNVERTVALVAALCATTSLVKNYNNYDFNPTKCVAVFVTNAVHPLGQSELLGLLWVLWSWIINLMASAKTLVDYRGSSIPNSLNGH